MTAPTADLIVRNARIYTVDGQRSWASEMAVRNGRVLRIGGAGASADVEGPDTEIVDAGGRMVMPGIIDVHTHAIIGGIAELFELRFPNTASVDELIEAVRKTAADTEPGKWIVGGQWGSDLLPKLNTLEALKALDAASAGHPVMLRDDTYHNRWINSEAMRVSQVTPDTPDPDQGSLGRDRATGALTGMFIEGASALPERALARSGHFAPEMNRAAMAQSIATLNSFGVTGFLDAAAMEPVVEAMKGLDDRGELTAWACAALPAVEPAFMFGAAGDELIAKRESFRSAHVKPDFVKVFLDGVPGAKTAAFLEPYAEDPVVGCCFRGLLLMNVPELIKWIGKCEDQDLAVKIHCAGDAAVAQALDAIEVVRAFNGPTKLIHHIAHASYIAPDDIARFAELGVAADLSPFLWYPTPFLEGHKVAMGTERAERFWPNKQLAAAGALLAAGSDWPVVPNPDPWNGIEGIVTRRNPDGYAAGKSLWPEEAVDLASAIEIFTINPAKAIGLSGSIGSLEIGKSADFLLLDRNVFEIPDSDIAKTKVLKTFFEGRLVFERAA